MAAETEPPFALRGADVTIVGLGLIGGSLAWALRERQLCRHVNGVTRRPESIGEALERGVVDWATTDLAAGVGGADIVVLAAPVRTILRQIPLVATWLKPGCVLLDVGSTKEAVVAAMALLPSHVQPIGGHPMCGKEKNGLAAADPALFEGAPFVLTPLTRTAPEAVALAEEMARGIGAHPMILEPGRHDRLVAAVSHLPYLLSAALMSVALQVGGTDEALWALAASGFRDTSRLAASDVQMMADILLTNRQAVGEMAQRCSAALERLAALIARDDEVALKATLSPLQAQRGGMFQGGRS